LQKAVPCPSPRWELPIADIRVGRRHRKDMGDIAELAASIAHAEMPLSDWKAFRDAPPRDLIEEVIDRSETDLPEYCAPLARGVAVASNSLLQKVGHVCGSGRPRRWHPLRADCNWGWDGVAFVRRNDVKRSA
jgi:hypothetical protein